KQHGRLAERQLHRAALHASLFGRTARLHHFDQQTFDERRLQKLLQVLADDLAVETDPRADHPAVGDQARHQLPGQIDRNREADVLRRVDDFGVDADYLAAAVEQRSARVARVDRRIGLDQRYLQRERRVRQQPVEPAHDPARDGLIEAERIADGDDVLTYAQ